MADGEPLPADQHSIGDTDTDDSSLSDFQAYELPQDVFSEALLETPSLDGLYTPYVSFHDTASSAATPGLHSNANATDLDVADENATESLVEAAMNTRYSDNVERSRGVARRHSPHQAAPAQLSVTSTHTLTQTHAHAHAHPHTHTHSRLNSLSQSQVNAHLPEDSDTHTHTPPPGKPLACHGRVAQVCTAQCVAASPTLSHLSSASYTGHSLSHNLSLTTSYTSQGNDDSDQGLLARTGPRTIKQVHSYTGTHTHSPTQRTRTRSQTNAHTSSHLSVQQRSPSAMSLHFTIDERNRTTNKQRTRTAGPKTNPSRCTRTNGPSRDTRPDEEGQGRSTSSSFPSSSSASFRESFSKRVTSPSGNMTRHYLHTTSLPDSLNSASSSAHLDPNHYSNDPDNNDYLQHDPNDSPDISHCILDRRSSNGSILRRSDIGSAEELYRSTRSSIFSKTIRRKSSMRKMKKIHKTLSWYEPDVKRAEVEDILLSAPPGTFVVRLARTGEDYCLSVRSDVEDKSVHILIERQTDGLQLGGDNVMFNNMQDLVTYYKKHKITIEGQLSTCLKKPMCKYAQL